jgi:hypothetical protein
MLTGFKNRLLNLTASPDIQRMNQTQLAKQKRAKSRAKEKGQE